jgi:hypothetical protein
VQPRFYSGPQASEVAEVERASDSAAEDIYLGYGIEPLAVHSEKPGHHWRTSKALVEVELRVVCYYEAVSHRRTQK